MKKIEVFFIIRSIRDQSFRKGFELRNNISSLRQEFMMKMELKPVANSLKKSRHVVSTSLKHEKAKFGGENIELKENTASHKTQKFSVNKSNKVCHFCGKSYKKASGLKVHIATIHNKEKKFRCDECDKSFGRLDTLNKHKRLHTREQDFVCEFCSRPFNQSSNLIKHRYDLSVQH